MALQPFTWSGGGEKLTPSQAAARRKMAEALLGPRPAATSLGGGLAEIGNALRGVHAQGQADAADAEHSTQRKAIMDALIGNPDPTMADIYGALGNDVVTSDPGSSAILQALAAQEIQQNDPLRQLQLEKGQFELDALRNPVAPEPDYPTSFDEWQLGLEHPEYGKTLGQGGQTINVGGNNDIGTIPPGMMVTRDEAGNITGMKPIPGGPAETEALAAAEAAALNDSRSDLKGGVVVQDIDRALQSITENPMMTTGIGSALTGSVPNTPAYDVNALIDTVKANAGFTELQQMRESSPTGGALGNVTEKEIAYLQATIGNLDPRQSPEQLADNLKRVKNAYLDVIHGPGNGPPREPLSFEDGGDAPTLDYNAETPPEGWGGNPALWQFMPPEDRALW